MFKNSLLLGIVANFLTFGVSLISFPLIIKYLTPEEYSIWMIFIVSSGLLEILDFGFGMSLARYFSYLVSGSEYIYKSQDRGDCIKLSIPELAAFSRKLYRYIFVIAFCVFGLGISAYLAHVLSSNNLPVKPFLVVWLIYCTANLFAFYYNFYTPIIIGHGNINLINQFSVFNKLISIVVIVVFVQKYKLMALAIGSLITLIFERYIFSIEFRKLNIVVLPLSRQRFIQIFPYIWHNVFKVGFNNVSTYVLNRLQALILPLYFPLGVLSNYLLTIQVFNIISTTAHTPISVKFNELCYYKNIDTNKANRIFLKNNLLSLLIFCVGFALFLLFGQQLLTLLNKNKHILSSCYLLLFGVVFFLEKQLLNHNTMIGAGNYIPMFKSLILSSVFSLGIGYVFLVHFRFGIVSFLLSQLLVQGSYNYWYWVRYNLKLMGLTYFNSLFIGVQLIFSRNK